MDWNLKSFVKRLRRLVSLPSLIAINLLPLHEKRGQNTIPCDLLRHASQAKLEKSRRDGTKLDVFSKKKIGGVTLTSIMKNSYNTWLDEY